MEKEWRKKEVRGNIEIYFKEPAGTLLHCVIPKKGWQPVTQADLYFFLCVIVYVLWKPNIAGKFEK